MRILLIEDDYLFGSTIKDYLMEEEDYAVDWVTEGKEAHIMSQTQEHFDLVILDLNIPQFDWHVWAENFRVQNQRTPILVLSANDEPSNILDIGINQFLPKDYFKIEKLSSILRTLLRRSNAQSAANIIEFNDIKMDLDTRLVTNNGINVKLSRREFSLAHKLLEQVHRVVERDHLEQSIYGWDKLIKSNTLDVHIYQLRWKLFGCSIRLTSNEKLLPQLISNVMEQKEIILLKVNSTYQVYFKSESDSVNNEVIDEGDKKLYTLVNKYSTQFTDDGSLLNKDDDDRELTKVIYKFVAGQNGCTELGNGSIKTVKGIGYSITDS